MRVLRSSLYLDPYSDPMTTVMRDCDANGSLESCRIKLLEPRRLVLSDLFEMGKTSIKTATLTAMQRMQEVQHTEKHMAMLYYWSVLQFEKIVPNGVLLMDKPAPLDEGDILLVFEQLKNHPRYRGFTIISHTRNGHQVTLKGNSESNS